MGLQETIPLKDQCVRLKWIYLQNMAEMEYNIQKYVFIFILVFPFSVKMPSKQQTFSPPAASVVPPRPRSLALAFARGADTLVPSHTQCSQ